MLAWQISRIAGSADDDTFDDAAFEEDDELEGDETELEDEDWEEEDEEYEEYEEFVEEKRAPPLPSAPRGSGLTGRQARLGRDTLAIYIVKPCGPVAQVVRAHA